MKLFDRVLVDTITIQKPVESIIDKQRKVDSWESIGANVFVRIQKLGGDLSAMQLGKMSTATHRIYMKNSISMKESYKIIDQDDKEYIVQDVNSCHGKFYILDVEEKHA